MNIIKQLAWKLYNFIMSKLNRYIIISISHQQYMSVIHNKKNYFLSVQQQREKSFFFCKFIKKKFTSNKNFTQFKFNCVRWLKVWGSQCSCACWKIKKIRHITSEVKCRHVDMLLLIAIIVAVSLHTYFLFRTFFIQWMLLRFSMWTIQLH